MTKPRIAIVAAVIAVGVGVWALFTPICACTTKEGAYAARLKSDLKNLVSAQEMHFADHGRYASDLADLEFKSTLPVTITLGPASDSAWSAVGVHHWLAGWCQVFVGPAPKYLPGAEPASPACRLTVNGKERVSGMEDRKD